MTTFPTYEHSMQPRDGQLSPCQKCAPGGVNQNADEIFSRKLPVIAKNRMRTANLSERPNLRPRADLAL